MPNEVKDGLISTEFMAVTSFDVGAKYLRYNRPACSEGDGPVMPKVES